jgi:hypothetical protein
MSAGQLRPGARGLSAVCLRATDAELCPARCLSLRRGRGAS